MATPLRDWRYPYHFPVVCSLVSCSKLSASGTAALLTQRWSRRSSGFVFVDPCHEEEELRAFWMKRYSPSTLADVTKSSWCCRYPVPTRRSVAWTATWDHYWHVLWEDLKRRSLSVVPSVFSLCFLEKLYSFASSPHTSSGSIGPSAPWGASVWSRRIGLLHMGHTLRISSHLSRHLMGGRGKWKQSTCRIRWTWAADSKSLFLLKPPLTNVKLKCQYM